MYDLQLMYPTCCPYVEQLQIKMNSQNINDMISSMARSGELNPDGFGGGYPIKTLAVLDGKTYEKDHSMVMTDMSMSMFRMMLTSQLPRLSEEETKTMRYSFSWIADEVVADNTFEVRKVSHQLENESDEKVDAIVKGLCVICKKKKDLMACSKCKHAQYCGRACQMKHWNGMEDRGRGKEWSHKKACKKLIGKPLRIDLDKYDDDMSMKDLPFDPTYGFVHVRKVPL